jgi:hypothetical protein
MKWIAILLLLSAAALAQSPRNVIWVEYTGSDSIGAKLVFEFKEEVRKSSGYQLENEKKLDFSEDHMIWLDIISVDDADAGRSGLSSAVSVVATASTRDFLRKCAPNSNVLHMVLVVGRDRTQSRAHQLLADLDKRIHDVAICSGNDEQASPSK